MSVSSRTRSKLKQRESISLLLNLPEEVRDEIFLKLPAKSILVSRCVCKLFCNLLSKPNFIKNHVILSKNRNPKLLSCQFWGVQPSLIHSLPFDCPSISSTPPSDGAVLINYPFQSTRIYMIKFFGSCNGLICSEIRSVDRASFREKYFMETKLCILNPLTREFKEFKYPANCCSSVTYGFGYDSSIDDYKLVLISVSGKINIYSLRSDSWSIIQGTVKFSFQGGKASDSLFFNGCLHWLGSIHTHEISSKAIFSFDISKEIMVNMPLPENIMPPKDYSGEVYKNVGVWGDCIGIACIWGSVKLDVWVMQEYGVKESWIKKYTTTQFPLLEIPFWRQLWCSSNGEFLVDAGGKQLLLYAPTNGRVGSVVVLDITMGSTTERARSVVVRGCRMDNSRETYVESIVSLGSGTYPKLRITDEIVKNPE